jgi:hypothetical protein
MNELAVSSDKSVITSPEVKNSKAMWHVLQCLSIEVFKLANAPVKELRIIERYSPKVFRVFFLPHGHLVKASRAIDLDPVIPCCIEDLGGNYRQAMGKLTRHLVIWDEGDDWKIQTEWATRAMSLADSVVDILRHSDSVSAVLSRPEIEYMIHHVMLSISVPFPSIEAVE